VTWEPLGAVAPRDLVAARLTLHWAAQLVAAAGAALVPARADDSHTALHWEPARRALVGEPIGARAVALVLADLALTVDGDRLDLAGRTRDEALAWLGAAFGVAPPAPYPHQPPGEPPERFVPAPAGQAELARWYADAALVLAPVAAAPIRTWPHHFDIATLFELPPRLSGAATLNGGAPETARRGGRTIGVGLSPGDASYAEPYFYVSPWPYPPDRAGPPLPAGRWHVEGWLGAVLVGSELVSHADTEAVARRFVDDALAACRKMLA